MSLPLPAPERAAEDRYVAEWQQADDPDGLVDCITAAMDARRPQLAARLVGLLDDQVEIPADSPLARAQRAARLLLLAKPATAPALVDELDQAWSEARRSRMTRVKARMRARNQDGAGVFLDSGSPRRRKPHLTGRNRRG